MPGMVLGTAPAGTPAVQPNDATNVAPPAAPVAAPAAPAPVDVSTLVVGTPEYEAAMAAIGRKNRGEADHQAPPAQAPEAKSPADGTPSKFLNTDGSVNTANFMKSFVSLGGDVTKVVKDGAIDVAALNAEYAAAERARSTKKDAPATPPADAPKVEPLGPIGDGEEALVAAAEKASAEFYATGSLSEQTIQAFVDKGIPKALIDSYVNNAKAAGDASRAAAELTAQQEQREVLEAIGGQDEFARLDAWATANLQPAELEALNAQISHSKASAVMALKGLRAMAGPAAQAPKLLQGAPSSLAGDIFLSKSELHQAQAHPDYQKSESYRNSVVEKLKRSRAAGQTW